MYWTQQFCWVSGCFSGTVVSVSWYCLYFIKQTSQDISRLWRIDLCGYVTLLTYIFLWHLYRGTFWKLNIWYEIYLIWICWICFLELIVHSSCIVIFSLLLLSLIYFSAVLVLYLKIVFWKLCCFQQVFILFFQYMDPLCCFDCLSPVTFSARK